MLLKDSRGKIPLVQGISKLLQWTNRNRDGKSEWLEYVPKKKQNQTGDCQAAMVWLAHRAGVESSRALFTILCGIMKSWWIQSDHRGIHNKVTGASLLHGEARLRWTTDSAKTLLYLLRPNKCDEHAMTDDTLHVSELCYFLKKTNLKWNTEKQLLSRFPPTVWKNMLVILSGDFKIGSSTVCLALRWICDGLLTCFQAPCP